MKRIRFKDRGQTLYAIEIKGYDITYVYSKDDSDTGKYLGKKFLIKGDSLFIDGYPEIEYHISLFENMHECSVCGCVMTEDEMEQCALCGEWNCGDEMTCCNYAYGDPQEDLTCINCE